MLRTQLKPEEVKYIRENCLKQTDKQIADYLKRDMRTISSLRRKLGVKKKQGGKVIRLISSSDINEPSGKNIVASQNLTEDQRKNFFRIQLTNSLFYNTLKEQLTDSEIRYYLEEWGTLCVQFEDIVATEKRQIDELIKATILGNRILRNIKIADDELKIVIKEIDRFRKDHPSIENDEDAQERDNQLMMLARMLGSQVEAMTKNYDSNVNGKNKLLEQLNARRSDRIDQIKRSNTTFIGLVEKFRDHKIREQEGRHTELVRLAKEQKKAKWRNQTAFPDGQIDSVLLDDSTILPEKDYVVSGDETKKLGEEETKNEKN